MKHLYIVPIVHAEEELGSHAGQLKKAYIKNFGLAGWKQHKAAIADFWSKVKNNLQRIDVDYNNLLIYQDGFPMGMDAKEMIDSMLKLGSPNYKIIANLVNKGAELIGTESPELLKKEFDHLKSKKTITLEMSNALLQLRDQFIAKQIEKTLLPGKTGILFIGAKHEVSHYFSREFQITLKGYG